MAELKKQKKTLKEYTSETIDIQINKLQKKVDKLNLSIENHALELKSKQDLLKTLTEDLSQFKFLKTQLTYINM